MGLGCQAAGGEHVIAAQYNGFSGKEQEKVVLETVAEYRQGDGRDFRQ